MAGLLNQQQGRKASADEQAQYKTIVTQVIKFINQNKDSLKQMVDQMGPEKGLAAVVSQALGLVGKAAQQAGAKVAMHTGEAALREIVTVLATALQAAGKVEDVQATVDEVVEMVMSGGDPDAGQEMPQEAAESSEQPMEA